MELTILMPCLNEEKTIQPCIEQAQRFLLENGYDGEILICDNGSTDASVPLAEKAGARVVHCPQKGYGNALRCGIGHAWGEYVIFGDCDLSYDFYHLDEMYRKLKSGCDMVIGDRFANPPEPAAMSLSHRIGIPILSWLGRIRYRCNVRDFHCGLRGFRRAAVETLDLKTGGMEFATEIIGKASLAGLSIGQVPIVLHPDGRGGKPHLRTVRDGLRHLRLIFFQM